MAAYLYTVQTALKCSLNLAAFTTLKKLPRKMILKVRETLRETLRETEKRLSKRNVRVRGTFRETKFEKNM